MAPKSARQLSGGSKVFDVELSDKNGKMLEDVASREFINLTMHRTLHKRQNNEPLAEVLVDAITESGEQRIPIMYTKFKSKQVSC